MLNLPSEWHPSPFQRGRWPFEEWKGYPWERSLQVLWGCFLHVWTLSLQLVCTVMDSWLFSYLVRAGTYYCWVFFPFLYLFYTLYFTQKILLQVTSPFALGAPRFVPGCLLCHLQKCEEMYNPFYADRANGGWDTNLGSLSTQSCEVTTSVPLLSDPVLDSGLLHDECRIWHNPSKLGLLSLPPPSLRLAEPHPKRAESRGSLYLHSLISFLLLSFHSPFLAESLLFLLHGGWGFPQF